MSGYLEGMPRDLLLDHKEKDHQIRIRPDTTTKEVIEAEEATQLPRYRLRRSLAGIAFVASVLNTAYVLPILNEEQRLSETHASIKEIGQPINIIDDQATTVVIGGFGTRDSEPIVNALPQLHEIGHVDAVEEDNSGVDADAMAKEIMQHAKEHHQTEIGLWGDSAGGLINARIARIIQTSDTNLRVRFLMLDCTPPTFEALRQDKQDQLQQVELLTKILPNIELHPAFQYFYTGITDGQNPVTLASGINGPAIVDEMNDPATASPALLESEARYVLSSGLKDDLEAISHVTSKQPPLIMSVRPTSSYGDKTVNSDYASRQLKSYIKGTSLTLREFKLDGISHGDPTANQTQYQAALSAQILPALLAYESELAEEARQAEQRKSLKPF